MRILIIDDDQSIGRAIQRMLKEHDVVLENDSPAAIARVLSADVEGMPFELVVCDFKMPGMSGLDVQVALQAHRDPPMFILISGSDNVVEYAPFVDGVLIKPFTARQLLDLITLVKDSRSRKQTQRLRRARPMSTSRQAT